MNEVTKKSKLQSFYFNEQYGMNVVYIFQLVYLKCTTANIIVLVKDF